MLNIKNSNKIERKNLENLFSKSRFGKNQFNLKQSFIISLQTSANHYYTLYSTFKCSLSYRYKVAYSISLVLSSLV